MALKNLNTNSRRFRVVTVGPKFALVDWETGDIKHFPSGTTHGHADRECAALNGTGSAKTPRDPPSLERRFRKRGELITFEEIDELDRRSRAMRHPINGPLDPEIYGHLRTARLQLEQQQKREIIASFERRLPGALTAWGAKVAEAHGYGGPKRKDWSVEQIITWVADTHDALEDVLVAHFVSAQPSHIKARYFGIEKRAYLNRVKAAIQKLARRLVDEPMGATMTAITDSWGEMLEREENSDEPPREDDWDIWGLE